MKVVALRAILKEEVTKKQVWRSCNNNNHTNTDMITGEDTVESTSVFPRQRKSTTARDYTRNNHDNMTANHQCNYVFEVDDYNNSANWGAASAGTAVMPSYP